MTVTREPARLAWWLIPGTRVIKTGGDYVFRGEVVAAFHKRSGALRVVVENDDGILHVFNPAQLNPEGDAA